MFCFGETSLIDAERHGDAEIEQISIYGIACLKTVHFRPESSAVFFPVCLGRQCSMARHCAALSPRPHPGRHGGQTQRRRRSEFLSPRCRSASHHTAKRVRKFKNSQLLKVDPIFCRRMQIRVCAACHSHLSREVAGTSAGAQPPGCSGSLGLRLAGRSRVVGCVLPTSGASMGHVTAGTPQLPGGCFQHDPERQLRRVFP